MNEIFKQIDAKVIRDSGLILLFGLALYMLFKILTNDISHIGDYIKEGTQVQRETVKGLEENAAAVQSNTEVLKILERRIK
mgnify:FL=1